MENQTITVTPTEIIKAKAVSAGFDAVLGAAGFALFLVVALVIALRIGGADKRRDAARAERYKELHAQLGKPLK